jgi:uncharacterized small protein (DUF1192 family)
MSETTIANLTDEEMVDWANASIERNAELEREVERLTAEIKRLTDVYLKLAKAFDQALGRSRDYGTAIAELDELLAAEKRWAASETRRAELALRSIAELTEKLAKYENPLEQQE